MEQIKLEDQIINDFEEYSKYVNEERAIPHVYDGQKPVARRILYTMRKHNLIYDKQTVKCATTVGRTMLYHPHGNSGIYGALVRMTQPFLLRVPLIFGQGNFGSEEMPPAAERYTEAKLSRMGEAMTQKLKKGIVPMVPNYDGTDQEPSFLYAPVPILLNMSVLGIGVGLQVSIPPHNLNEIIDATVYLIENPHAETEDLLQHIKGPDFPSGCEIVNQEDFLKIYREGKGSFVLRSSFTFTGNTLTIKNLPLYSIAAKIEEQIYEAKNKGLFKEIVKVVNTTSQSQELTLQLKSKFDAENLIKELCKETDAERSMYFNLRAVDNGVPKHFSLLEYLRRWLEIHKTLVKKEKMIELVDLKHRLEIVEGLNKALIHIDEIIKTIKSSENKSLAKTAIMNMGFSEVQATAILDLKLSRLTKLEQVELDQQISELKQGIELINILLSQEKEFNKLIINQLLAYKGYDSERQSSITNARFPKIVKVKQDKAYLTFSQGIVRVTDEIPKAKHLITTSKNPVFLLIDNYIVPVKNSKEPVYTKVFGILDDSDVLHFSVDGYVKKTQFKDLQVTRKAVATKQDKIHSIIQANSGMILITSKSGKQLQFDIAEVPYSKRGAKGVMAVKLEGEQIEKIELIKSPVKGVVKGRNKKMK